MATVDTVACDVFECKICKKNYKDRTGLWRHNNKYHSTVVSTMSTIDKTNTCEYCNKILSNRQSRWRHEKTCKCKNKQQLENLIYKKTIDELIEKQKYLDTQIEKLKNKSVNKIINYTQNNNNKQINNICQIGKESINLLTKEELKYIKSQGLNSIISLIDNLNFNERLPCNHNFYTSAINDKNINRLDSKGNIIKQSKRDLFDQILFSHMGKLEQMGTGDHQFKIVFEKLRSFIYLEGKKEFVKQANLLSYNKRQLIIKTWEKLIADTVPAEEFSTKFEEEVKQIASMSEEECSENTTDYNSSSSDDESDSEDRPVLFPNNKKHIIV